MVLFGAPFENHVLHVEPLILYQLQHRDALYLYREDQELPALEDIYYEYRGLRSQLLALQLQPKLTLLVLIHEQQLQWRSILAP